MNEDVKLYKELVEFCNNNKDKIETKFDRKIEFTDFNETCFQEMYLNIKNEANPLAPKILKDRVKGLTECYRFVIPMYMKKRNESIKGLDIQLGQWYEKAFQMFLASKGVNVQKKGFPFPDFIVGSEENPKAYFEFKFIEAPFISANNLVKNTYPYETTRFDYECSLTLDTGKKLKSQRDKIETDLDPKGIPTYYIWWFDAPHLKGVFYMKSTEVFDFWDNVGTLFEREEREGDKIAEQIKGKIYPPLLKMESLSSLIKKLS